MFSDLVNARVRRYCPRHWATVTEMNSEALVAVSNRVFARAADHLRALTARERSIVLDAVEDQLAHEPTVETRNRKPMRPNPLAPWELRIESLRVY